MTRSSSWRAAAEHEAAAARQAALRIYRDAVHAVLEQDGLALEAAAAHLQDDREIVVAAVRQSGFAMKFAPRRCAGRRRGKRLGARVRGCGAENGSRRRAGGRPQKRPRLEACVRRLQGRSCPRHRCRAAERPRVEARRRASSKRAGCDSGVSNDRSPAGKRRKLTQQIVTSATYNGATSKSARWEIDPARCGGRGPFRRRRLHLEILKAERRPRKLPRRTQTRFPRRGVL